MDLKTAFLDIYKLLKARDWVGNPNKARLILNKLEVLRKYPDMEHFDANLPMIIEAVGNDVFMALEPYFNYESPSYQLLRDQFYSNMTIDNLYDSL